jgi:hypothetical protein
MLIRELRRLLTELSDVRYWGLVIVVGLIAIAVILHEIR